MAILLSNKNEVELRASRSSRRLPARALATLVLTVIATSSIAQPTHRIEHRLSNGRSFLEATQAAPGRGTLHAVRYGKALTGVVEYPTKSGYLNRTYVQAGHVLYARVYRRNTYQRFGHAFSYETLVPGIAFGTAYYAWATRRWSAPVSYRWGWETEPWHKAFGSDFTPYQDYTSLDEWLTDYLVAQNLRNAYESWQAENQRPYWDEPDDGRRPYWEEASATDTPAQSASARPNSSKKHGPASNTRAGSQSRPPGQDSPAPLSGDIKAKLNRQIKRQLIERQTHAATSGDDDLPESLKPGHTLFRVNTALDVPSKGSGQYCSLRTNDYIERIGDMDENGMVAVKVEVGAVSDCAVGLTTNVSVNDLEAMEGEQQQALTDALLAASKNMGGSQGLPQAPATTPVLLAAGQARPAPDAMTTLSQLQ
jgi:hypothetical protein